MTSEDFDNLSCEEMKAYFNKKVAEAVRESFYKPKVEQDDSAGYLKQIQDIDSFLKPHYNSIIKEELSPQLEYVDSSIKIENGVAVLKLKTRYIGPAIETATIQVTIDYDK